MIIGMQTKDILDDHTNTKRIFWHHELQQHNRPAVIFAASVSYLSIYNIFHIH